MLSFQDFFTACAGVWTTERTYHSVLQGEIERSYTKFRATSLDQVEKQQILSGLPGGGSFAGIKLDMAAIAQQPDATPGFAIAFDTRSETGEEVSMSLKGAVFARYLYANRVCFAAANSFCRSDQG